MGPPPSSIRDWVLDAPIAKLGTILQQLPRYSSPEFYPTKAIVAARPSFPLNPLPFLPSVPLIFMQHTHPPRFCLNPSATAPALLTAPALVYVLHVQRSSRCPRRLTTCLHPYVRSDGDRLPLTPTKYTRGMVTSITHTWLRPPLAPYRCQPATPRPGQEGVEQVDGLSTDDSSSRLGSSSVLMPAVGLLSDRPSTLSTPIDLP
jgi:hypothetical protein